MEYFIAKRLQKKETRTKKVSRSIVSIAVMSIALAMSVNLITIFIIKGFQAQVKDKVTGFGAHLVILAASEGELYDARPMLKKQDFLPEIKKIKGIKNVVPVAYKPVLLQSEKQERTAKLSNNKDTTIIEQNIHGVMLKGVDEHYDWTFFREQLIDGNIPNFNGVQTSTQIVISQKIANELHFQVGDTVRAYFVRSTPILKRLIISGIYKTGLEEYDKKTAIADLRLVQELNDWGIQTTLDIKDSVYRTPGFQDQLIVKTTTRGGRGQLRYDWGNGHELYGAKLIHIDKDTTIQVIVSDFSTQLQTEKSLSIADTARLKITVQGNTHADNLFETDEHGELIKRYSDDSGTKYTLQSGEKTVTIELEPGKGSSQNYVAGFELTVNNWDKLDAIQQEIHSKIAFVPTNSDELLSVRSIREMENDMFTWLDFLDLNVLIIIVLMVLIGIINMGSTMLVMILIRTNFIGILKTLGSTNWSIQKIFLTQATFLILRGMLIGNVLGLGLAALQYYFQLVPLNAEVYYLNTVPIDWNWTNCLLLNLGTIVVCVCALIVPSGIISRMNPAKSVRF